MLKTNWKSVDKQQIIVTFTIESRQLFCRVINVSHL